MQTNSKAEPERAEEVAVEATAEVSAEVAPKAAGKAAQVKSSCGFSAYVGPTLLGTIQHNTLYPCGKAEALKRPEVVAAVKKRPAIARLIVSGDELAEAGKKIKIKGAPLYQAYRDALTK